MAKRLTYTLHAQRQAQREGEKERYTETQKLCLRTVSPTKMGSTTNVKVKVGGGENSLLPVSWSHSLKSKYFKFTRLANALTSPESRHRE